MAAEFDKQERPSDFVEFHTKLPSLRSGGDD